MLRCCSIERGGLSEHESGGIAPAKDFTGARMVSAVNSIMIKRALLVVGFLALCFPLAAQTPSLDASSAFAFYRPEIFSTVDSLALIDRLPVLNFLDGTRLAGLERDGPDGNGAGRIPFAHIYEYERRIRERGESAERKCRSGIGEGRKGFVR